MANMQTLNGSSRPVMAGGRSLMSEFGVEEDPGNSEREHEEAPTIMVLSEETEPKCTQWTDEKHSLYLKSMEASFVNQLYDSLDTIEPISSRQMHSAISNSHQFKVLKDGSWARVNFSKFSDFRREMPRPKRVEKSDHILANPWIQHYRSLDAHQNRISPSLRGHALASAVVDSSTFQFSCQGAIGITSEGTDQNFVDEVPEEEKPSKIRRQKCRKISAASGLRNDQVVPFANLSIENIAKMNGPLNE